MAAPHLAPLIFLPTVKIKNILFATDFSPCSETALRIATAVARVHASNLLVAHVVPPGPLLGTSLDPVTWDHQNQAEEAEERIRQIAISLIDIPHRTELKMGNLWPVIYSLIAKYDIDLVIVGTHGRSGFSKLFLGSNAEEIYRQAPCPVMTVGPEVDPELLDRGRFSSILFAGDFAGGSEHAFPLALALAEENQALLTMLHTVEEGTMAALYLHQRLVRESKSRLEKLIPTDHKLQHPPEIVIRVGYAAEEIVNVARSRDCDLIVMGVHPAGPTAAKASAHLPWTIANTVIRNGHCPVITVRG
ncbi:MAG TPA: universal stress protein [Terriglobales bacterium]|nr:universal stress protein [Terriglobales bacterium]